MTKDTVMQQAKRIVAGFGGECRTPDRTEVVKLEGGKLTREGTERHDKPETQKQIANWVVSLYECGQLK